MDTEERGALDHFDDSSVENSEMINDASEAITEAYDLIVGGLFATYDVRRWKLHQMYDLLNCLTINEQVGAMMKFQSSIPRAQENVAQGNWHS